MLAKKKKNVAREELDAELQEFGIVQRVQEHQLGQIRALFNSTVEAINQFMANTNKTLQLTQDSQKLMMRRTEALERWIKEFSDELDRRNRLMKQKMEKK